ncbi:MAG: hypothetical protein ACTS6G_05805, partial [Candidatus Hodgkinia cicadicola]
MDPPNKPKAPSQQFPPFRNTTPQNLFPLSNNMFTNLTFVPVSNFISDRWTIETSFPLRRSININPKPTYEVWFWSFESETSKRNHKP